MYHSCLSLSSNGIRWRVSFLCRLRSFDSKLPSDGIQLSGFSTYILRVTGTKAGIAPMTLPDSVNQPRIPMYPLVQSTMYQFHRTIRYRCTSSDVLRSAQNLAERHRNLPMWLLAVLDCTNHVSESKIPIVLIVHPRFPNLHSRTQYRDSFFSDSLVPMYPYNPYRTYPSYSNVVISILTDRNIRNFPVIPSISVVPTSFQRSNPIPDSIFVIQTCSTPIELQNAPFPESWVVRLECVLHIL